MELIYYRGLNCHLASLVNLASLLGINYLDAFSTLWSETEFTDEEEYDIYVSKRVFANLRMLGALTVKLPCDEANIKDSLSQIRDGEFFLIGMDTYYIPWHPVFRHFHDPHFIFARKETAQSFLCFDPVYQQINRKVMLSDVGLSFFELCRVRRIDPTPFPRGVALEAEAVVRCHPETARSLLSQIAICKGGERSGILRLIKQFSALINNRYLFQRFLRADRSLGDEQERLFGASFFEKWEAVRSGLYKATIVKDNARVIDEVQGLFADLMDEEMAIARLLRRPFMPE